MDSNRVKRFVDGLQRRSVGVAQSLPTNPDAGDRQSPSAGVQLLAPDILAKVGQLELLSTRLVDGIMSGVHRSTHRGGCCEFVDHRPYAPGDEIRLVDWRMYARRDRYYVKQFEDETNLQAWLVLDCSGSMNFGMSTPSKFDFARIACACLGRLLLKQRDSIGLLAQRTNAPCFVPAKPQANHFQSIVERIEALQATGDDGLSASLVELTQRARRRGMVLVFSDCFGPLEPMLNALKNLRMRGHDVIMFQVLAPEEIEFPFRRPGMFTDLEQVAPGINVNPGLIRRRYLERFNAFRKELDSKLTDVGCDRITLTTDSDLGETLSLFLRRRMSAKRN